MDAATEYVYVDLEMSAAPTPRSRSATHRPFPQHAANDQLMALPGEHAPDTVEIELDAEQMDALLEGRLVL